MAQPITTPVENWILGKQDNGEISIYMGVSLTYVMDQRLFMLGQPERLD